MGHEESVMEFVEIRDGTGRTFEILDYKGFLWPKSLAKFFPAEDPSQHFQNIQNMRVRADDVFICTASKSGTHWLWEIVTMLSKGNAEYEERSMESSMLEFHSPVELENLSSPRILSLHFPTFMLPTDLFNKKNKIIHMRRNPKDIAVSLYNHLKAIHLYEGSFQEFIPLFAGYEGKTIFTSWFDYELAWERLCEDQPGLAIFNLTFEDLKQSPVAEVSKLSRFLELPDDDHLIQKVVHKCHFENLKKANDSIKDDRSKVPGSGVSDSPAFMYRKGVVGDWKNWFTVAMNEKYDALYKHRMKDSKIDMKFTI